MTMPARRCTPGWMRSFVEGARRMLAAALEAEVDGYIDAFADERDERGPPAGDP